MGVARAIHEPRRRDRAAEDPWIEAYLSKAPFGFLAAVDADQPFLNSNLFVFDSQRRALYLHTHRTGRTRDNLVEPRRVAFSAASMGRLLPAKQALEFSVEYEGVVVFGWGRLVTDPEEAERALQLLLDKYAPHLRPGTDYRPIVPEELERTAVFRVDVEAWSGKRKEAEADFPGAYRYEDVLPESSA